MGKVINIYARILLKVIISTPSNPIVMVLFPTKIWPSS